MTLLTTLSPFPSRASQNFSTQASHNTIDRLRSYLTKNSIFKKFSLRVHKFAFQWELAIHLVVCIISLAPFFFTGRRVFSLLPISVWLFYNVLFLIGPQHSNKVIPRFGRIKNSFKNNIEEFFSPKLLPVLSISFLCVVLSLAVTGGCFNLRFLLLSLYFIVYHAVFQLI